MGFSPLRDLGLLIACLVGILLSVYQDGDYALRLRFQIPIESKPGYSYKNAHSPDPSEKVYVDSPPLLLSFSSLGPLSFI
jgi:hypothetical protein